MTKYRLYLTFLLIAAGSCRHSNGQWQDRDKWILNDLIQRSTLRNRPRQVTEYIYLGSDTLKRGNRGLSYIQYSFDTGGKVISRNSYDNDSLTMKIDRWMDGDGMQEKMTNVQTGQVFLTISRRLGDARYKMVTAHLRGGFTAWLIRFVADGDEKIQELYSDTAARGKPDQILHFYYKGSKLVRLTAETTEGAQELRYYYSGSDAPDSILTYRGGPAERTLVQRDLFFRNDHGDATREVTITRRDTTSLEENSYTYDSKGNWIRKVSDQLEGGTPNAPKSKRTVADRIFVYYEK
jgi:hypothetical protein